MLSAAGMAETKPWPADRPAKVFAFKIDHTIDPRMNRRVKLALKEAESEGSDLVIIEMDTYGGALNDADDIRTRLLNYTIPVYVFIDKDAASAGALISIACDSIYMAPGASIGAATVVTQDGQAAPDKYQSYMRSIMRSTAEAKGRNPRIAEAMVDQSIQIDSISQEGKVITFSTTEAIRYHFCEAQVNNIDDILKRAGISSYERTDFKMTGTEKIISFFLNPLVSGLLLMIIIGGIYFELQTPGVGFPLLAALTAVALYFVPYYLNGLATHWEILLFAIGAVLLALEVFVIPGFGVAGISGIVLIAGSLVLSMLNNDWFDFSFVSSLQLSTALSTIFIALVVSFAFMLFMGARLRKFRIFQRLALQDSQQSREGYSSNFKDFSLKGKKGVAFTRLRPSGKVEIKGEIYDAYTRGEFIDAGKTVLVIEEVGNSIKVRELASDDHT